MPGPASKNENATCNIPCTPSTAFIGGGTCVICSRRSISLNYWKRRNTIGSQLLEEKICRLIMPRTLPNSSTVQTDATKFGLGAVVLLDWNNFRRPVVVASHTLTLAE
ncbi:uncharacterized protein LOC144146823 isoform X2 [Haemaphysalis longicornis]